MASTAGTAAALSRTETEEQVRTLPEWFFPLHGRWSRRPVKHGRGNVHYAKSKRCRHCVKRCAPDCRRSPRRRSLSPAPRKRRSSHGRSRSACFMLSALTCLHLLTFSCTVYSSYIPCSQQQCCTRTCMPKKRLGFLMFSCLAGLVRGGRRTEMQTAGGTKAKTESRAVKRTGTGVGTKTERRTETKIRARSGAHAAVLPRGQPRSGRQTQPKRQRARKKTRLRRLPVTY